MTGNSEGERSGQRLSNPEKQLPNEDNVIELPELPGASAKPPPPLLDPYTNEPILPLSSQTNELPEEDFDQVPPPKVAADPWRERRTIAALPPRSGSGVHTYEATPPPYRQIVDSPFPVEEPEEDSLSVKALGGSATAALIGILLWAMICQQTQADAPWMAAAIGSLTGLASYFLGGRTHKMGLICGGFTVAAAVAGRQLTLQLLNYSPPNQSYFGFLAVAIFLAFFLGGTKRI